MPPDGGSLAKPRSGMRSASRKSKDKESRWMKDHNHKISRQIVNFAVANGVEIIRMENLTDIRNRAKSKKKAGRNLHSWAFYQPKEMILYKAEMVGIRFEEVKRNTQAKPVNAVIARKQTEMVSYY
jgi:IS605 OrfB family transposase